MFRVRRSKLPLLASAVGATLPAWGFAQNSATWTFAGTGGNNGPWTATWTDTTVFKPWAPNNTYPNAGTANPLFGGTFTGVGLGQITLPSSVLVNSLNFYGTGANNLTTPGNSGVVGYKIVGSGTINIIPTSGTQAGTIDVQNIGRDNTTATPITLPGIATISASIVQAGGTLYKTGVGTLVLDGTNNFTGSAGIQVNAGVLRIGNSEALRGVTAIATGNNGAIELYNNAGATNFMGTVAFNGLGSGTPSANGVLAAMGGSNSTWGGASSLFLLYGNPSVGAAASSTLTIGGTLLDLGTNGLTKVGAGTVKTPGLGLTGPLNVNAGTHVIRAGATPNLAANVSTMSGLTIAGGGTPTASLDITNNALIVNNANLAAATATHARLNSQALYASDSLVWDRPGLTSSVVSDDLNNVGTPTGIGIMLNNDGSGPGGNLFYGSGGDFPQFQGHNVNENTVLIKYTYLGDSTLDGVVDSVDFSLFQAGFTNSGAYTGWAFGDFDYNGVVDSVDFSLFQAGFLGQGSPLAPALAAEITAFGAANGFAVDPAVAAAIPEPATFGLAAIGLSALGLRKRRRN